MANLRHDTPRRPMPGAEKERIVLRPRMYETGPEKAVDVIPHQFGENEVEVYHPNGTWSSVWRCGICPDVGVGGKVGPIPAEVPYGSTAVEAAR